MKLDRKKKTYLIDSLETRSQNNLKYSQKFNILNVCYELKEKKLITLNAYDTQSIRWSCIPLALCDQQSQTSNQRFLVRNRLTENDNNSVDDKTSIHTTI